MTKRSMYYLIFIQLFVLINSYEFNPTDYELYGPTLAANDQFIVALQSRTGITFSAVTNYLSTTSTHCTVSYITTPARSCYATMIAVGRNSLSSANVHKFVFITYSHNDTSIYMVTATIAFSTCQLTILHNQRIVITASYPSYSVLGVNADSKLAFYIADTNTYIQDLFSPFSSKNWSALSPYPPSNRFIPVGIDLKNSSGILAAYTRNSTAPARSTDSKFRPTIYQVDFSTCFLSKIPSCIMLTAVEQISYPFAWQSAKAPPTDAVDNEYDSLYDISVSINDKDYVLIGIQSINTVYCFSAASTAFNESGSRIPSTITSIGFGKGVGWLDNTTAAVLLNNFTIDYAQWRTSHIELYPITDSTSLSNTISAYSSYPNAHQQLWPPLNDRLIDMLAMPGSGSVIYMDYVGNVHVVRPSPAASFAYTYGGVGKPNNTIYVAPTMRCPSGTLKNQSAYGKEIFRHCVLCPEGTFHAPNRSNQTDRCTPCDTSLYFCPWGAVTEMPISILDTISQAHVYPQSPENDGFEDILLLNMFNIEFPAYCIAKQPLFYGVIIIGVGCLFLLVMGILKLTGKLKKQRRMIKSVFKQTDLIGEGELWIGGVASLAIMVVSILAFRFSSKFMYQYPIETATDATFACDPTLRNAKFSTSMQSLGTPLLDDEQPLFDMLNSQSFTLNVAFISTDFTADQLSVEQVLGSIRIDLPFIVNETDGILYISTNLTSHSTTIQFTVLSGSAVGALRIGLSGPAIQDNNYNVKELNFSYAFNHTDRTVTQDPIITVQLIKLINETEPLLSSDQIQYSGIWVPTFIKNEEQLFYTESDFQLYHTSDRTVFTVQLTEATYYIYNQQEPITKLTEVIFTDILFTTMCIELFALTFLFFKLAILPLVRIILALIFKSNKVSPKKKTPGGCPYCRSVDSASLPTQSVPVKRSQNNTKMHSMRRPIPESGKTHVV
ncbi:hypothetical protein I4U23_029898 [Adineta vaga]|nr:hypothetical protein I4U23_029898 [Adineta vaga]